VALTRSQRSIAATIIGRGRRRHATRRELLAAIETGLVESNLSNPRGGSGSSSGWRQETAESYPSVNRRNVAAAADRFFSEARAKRGSRGRAGDLAQAVQRSAFPARYEQRRGEALDVLRSVDPSEGLGGDSGGQDSLSVLLRQQSGQQALQPPDMTAVNLLAQGLQKPAPPPLGSLTPPAFSAKAPMPAQAQQLPSAGPPTPPAPTLDDQLQAVAQITGQVPEQPQTLSTVIRGQQEAEQRQSGHYPLGKHGKIIGTPHTGTHTLGNWQSDNAVDIGVPEGTPVYATTSGVISKAGSLGAAKGSRFAGDRVQIDGHHNSFWYGHLSRLTVKAGQKVRQGQLIGYSGSANGVAHLHIASQRGNPQRMFG
jgi:murein DD-endopeptidase MepM/ murein hydrolase activator NlpD